MFDDLFDELDVLAPVPEPKPEPKPKPKPEPKPQVEEEYDRNGAIETQACMAFDLAARWVLEKRQKELAAKAAIAAAAAAAAAPKVAPPPPAQTQTLPDPESLFQDNENDAEDEDDEDDDEDEDDESIPDLVEETPQEVQARTQAARQRRQERQPHAQAERRRRVKELQMPKSKAPPEPREEEGEPLGIWSSEEMRRRKKTDTRTTEAILARLDEEAEYEDLDPEEPLIEDYQPRPILMNEEETHFLAMRRIDESEGASSSSNATPEPQKRGGVGDGSNSMGIARTRLRQKLVEKQREQDGQAPTPAKARREQEELSALLLKQGTWGAPTRSLVPRQGLGCKANVRGANFLRGGPGLPKTGLTQPSAASIFVPRPQQPVAKQAAPAAMEQQDKDSASWFSAQSVDAASSVPSTACTENQDGPLPSFDDLMKELEG